mgnify:CR=1 FL=1
MSFHGWWQRLSGNKLLPHFTTKNPGISTILKVFQKNEFAQWILYKSQWTEIRGKSTKNGSIYNMAAMIFSRQNSLVTLRNQNQHCYLTEKTNFQNLKILSRENVVIVRLWGDIFNQCGNSPLDARKCPLWTIATHKIYAHNFGIATWVGWCKVSCYKSKTNRVLFAARLYTTTFNNLKIFTPW